MGGNEGGGLLCFINRNAKIHMRKNNLLLKYQARLTIEGGRRRGLDRETTQGPRPRKKSPCNNT